ncbi:spondin domain-containing protein [Oceanihabitans sp.]|nr:spondin domain-containing protein [Oceanihabitans sp.]
MKKITLLLFLISVCFISQIQSQTIANYDISLTTIWNSSSHTSVPGGAHWSDLIGASHSSPNEFFELGVLASQGIKNVAEGGSNGAITSEITAAISAGNADQLLHDMAGFNPFGPVATSGFSNITLSEDFPLVTLVSMVAPSPDWFIAINSLNLRSGDPLTNNGWKGTFTMDVFAYDADTDSGSNYTSSNMPIDIVDQNGVFLITGAPINGNRMGTITFTYLTSTLSIEESNRIENVKIYPNPSQGNVSISNAKDLETIEIYNILGRLVKRISVDQDTTLDLNLSNLSKGMYLIKVTDLNASTKSQKLILK